MALLRLAGLDAELDRLRGTMASMMEPLERQRSQLGEALKRDEACVLAMSREIQGKAAELADQGESVLARVSPLLRERYEKAVQKGQQPALAAMCGGPCPGCGAALPDASRRLVQASPHVVACSGCLRLLYDRGWIERDLIPRTLRPLSSIKP